MVSSPLRFALLHWVALLGFALVAPAGLPAGGGELRQPQIRRRQARQEPLISLRSAALRCSPRHQAPSLGHVVHGAPLRPLRSCWDAEGRAWLQVESLDQHSGLRRRGWVEASLAG